MNRYQYTALAEIITSCKSLKYTHHNSPSCALTYNCNLEEVYIKSSGTDAFMHSVSAHGGLVLCVASATGEGVATLIVNSPKLTIMTIIFHVYTEYISFIGTTFSLDLFEVKKFARRKQFYCGSYKLKLVEESLIFTNRALEDLLQYRA